MRNKGITLVALVVTIIVLIILAGVSIHLILGENGILRMAKEAKEKHTNAQEKENIELSKLNDTERPIIMIEEEDTWSNEGKMVTLNNKEGYITKYTTNGSDPSDDNGIEYKEPFKVTDNGEIKVAYISQDTAIAGEIVTKEITKIDKNAPDKLGIKVTPGKKAVTVQVTEAEDAKETPTDASSGIAEYRFKNNTGEWTNWQKETTYTFNNIYGNLAGVDCRIQAEVKDHAGNISEMEVAETTKTTCLNTSYYTTTARKTIMSVDCADGYGDYTLQKNNSEGGICSISFYRWSQSNRMVICPVVVSNTASGAQIYAINYRDVGSGVKNAAGINYHGVTYYYCTACVLEQHIFSRYYNAGFPVLRKLVQYVYFSNSSSNSIIR